MYQALNLALSILSFNPQESCRVITVESFTGKETEVYKSTLPETKTDHVWHQDSTAAYPALKTTPFAFLNTSKRCSEHLQDCVYKEYLTLEGNQQFLSTADSKVYLPQILHLSALSYHPTRLKSRRYIQWELIVRLG